MIKSAHCPGCDCSLPMGPGKFTRIMLPPRAVMCPDCGLPIATTFGYRTTWLSGQIFKVLLVIFGIGFPAMMVAAGISEGDGAPTIAFMAAFGAVLGALGAALGMYVLAFPLQIVIDVVRAVVSPVPRP